MKPTRLATAVNPMAAQPESYYIQRTKQLEQQVKQLQKIISELTAQDTEPLPFTSWGD
jgi:phage host-nuclease inhibitor protein Gam